MPTPQHRNKLARQLFDAEWIQGSKSDRSFATAGASALLRPEVRLKYEEMSKYVL